MDNLPSQFLYEIMSYLLPSDTLIYESLSKTI